LSCVNRAVARRIVERLRREVQPRAAPGERARERGRGRNAIAWREHDVRLGLGEPGAEEGIDIARADANALERCTHFVLHAGRNARRAGRNLQTRIGVTACEVDRVREVREKGLGQLLRGRRAESDRVSRARIERDAVVRDMRREVEHVAGREHRVVRRGETREDLERQARDEAMVALRAPAPAAAPESLQEEHVVGVEVRPDAAVRRRVADHQVVEARVGDEREAPHQRIRASVDEIHALDEQRPRAFRQAGERAAGERSVIDVPAPAFAHDEPRLDVVACGEREKRRARERAGEAGQRGTHEACVPVPRRAQKGRGCRAERRRIHGRADYRSRRMDLPPRGPHQEIR